ncbi:MAG: hypothetical protein JWO00_658 [Candidatus Parcubacteria bacterium]|nr:hypothetical protein [Candidatus Parcubacteria bacterium]
MEDPVNVILCFIGIFVWPGMTLCFILWSLGHPILGIIALFSVEATTKIRKVVKEKFIDSNTGQIVKETESEE